MTRRIDSTHTSIRRKFSRERLRPGDRYDRDPGIAQYAGSAGAPTELSRHQAERICTIYRQALTRHCATRLANMRCDRMREAEDIVHELIVGVLAGRISAPPANIDPLAWYKGVATKLIQTVKRGSRNVVPITGPAGLAIIDSSNPERQAELTELAERVSPALAILGERRRQIARLHWAENWTVPEIAVEFGLSQSTVWTHLYRGRKQLQKCLCDLDPRQVRASTTEV